MIRIITGYMGSGKSLFAVRWLYRNRNKYKTILTNTPLTFPSQLVDHKNLLKRLKEAEPPIALFLDEAHLVMDSRRSMSKSNVTWTRLLTLLRKMQIDLILTTQSLMQVDIRLRSLLRTFWIAKGVQWLETTTSGTQPFFVYEQYKVLLDPWDGKYIRLWLRTEYLWWENAKLYFKLYDTNYIPALWDETEEEEKATVIDPLSLVGEYKKAREIQQYLRAMGFKATDANYRRILQRLGLTVVMRQKADGTRIYTVSPRKQQDTEIEVA